MPASRYTWFTLGTLLVIMLMFAGSLAKMAPKNVTIVRNDATSNSTVEFHSGDEWKQLMIEAQKDTPITGDRIRVATTRDDKAIITVDLPIQGGKKYRLFWNEKISIWDFSSAN